ncbi:winged helix-turn-helix domain-containing protein [Streptomyces sp. NPDC005438]|uniref:ArsR/SmtB family transcription factor n=1 Tax=Streptomyces sp. NPDC005438 TaxID=3156880 RepID=UPI00339FC73F
MTPTPPPGPSGPRLAALAGLLADQTRAAICLALLDGRAWTAGELARHCGVAPSTATEHLSRLVDGELLAEHRQGRHRYLRLADSGVAHLVEDLAAQAAPDTSPPRGLRARGASEAMARGRTCYDHLAGRLGVTLTEALTTRGLLDQGRGCALTDRGVSWFTDLGAALPTRARGRRPLVRLCLDWTERRPHLAGVAGATLCRHALERGWCERIGSQRAVRLTPYGRDTLATLLDLPADHLP